MTIGIQTTGTHATPGQELENASAGWLPASLARRRFSRYSSSEKILAEFCKFYPVSFGSIDPNHRVIVKARTTKMVPAFVFEEETNFTKASSLVD